jgi:hypothetical protein
VNKSTIEMAGGPIRRTAGGRPARRWR